MCRVWGAAVGAQRTMGIGPQTWIPFIQWHLPQTGAWEQVEAGALEVLPI